MRQYSSLNYNETVWLQGERLVFEEVYLLPRSGNTAVDFWSHSPTTQPQQQISKLASVLLIVPVKVGGGHQQHGDNE